MKSIQSKIILIIITAIIVATSIIGLTGIASLGKATNENSVREMNLTCSEKAQEFNTVLGRVEQSVKILSEYTTDNLASIDQLGADSEYLKDYTNTLRELSLTVANATNGAVAVYVRFSPDITSCTDGIFEIKDESTGKFKEEPLTDFSKYSKDDDEHVGWYYIPVNAGHAMWLQPYKNKNIGIYMISYVIPVYKNGELFGVVGMDIDFDYIAKLVDDIKIYDTGHAFIMDKDFTIVHSKHYKTGTVINELSESLAGADTEELMRNDTMYEHELDGIKKKMVFQSLDNGMILAVTVPVSEIDATKNKLILQIVAIALVVVLAFVILGMSIAETIVKPLRKLNDAAKEIAKGNLDVSLECESRDEVGTLAKSLEETVRQLKQRINYINNLAYMDKLTDTKNNTAYLAEIASIEEGMKEQKESFATFVIDVNGLKNINDAYGHSYGNELIIAVSQVAADVFGRENVYRIGGDEFAIILRFTGSLANDEMEQAFEEGLKKISGNVRPSAAIGSAVYEKDMDNSYEAVFARADAHMYEKKTKMKAVGETSKVRSGQEEFF
ncbi:MAG: diguanylate cyclase [Butyribacter sp.]|nr:diguanylate cyclase [bacterium]MDY3853962.1 diguanylate cyclase [Butyribacter sp.]